MPRLIRLSVIVLLGLAAVGCGASGAPSTPGSAATSANTAATARPTPIPTPIPPECPPMTEGAIGANQTVPALANIYGAGHEIAPMPGGGGGGVLPPVWELPAGEQRVVTISCAVGLVNPIEMFPNWNGPNGDRVGPTDVEAHGGISGIVHRRNGMFLVGVFLTDATPEDPAPADLDFTDTERFEELAPEIGQTFFVGDGRGRRFIVPAAGTRLFLGFADGYLYVGPPGWYNNNLGQLDVTVEVSAG